ncbi:hypothetical protein [Puniceibacterium sediminis]|uniref:Uncharacterized protein n=1 Tax=Puniceibacterium sediminis TaxID=1608407 RepID=A0A238WE08_9RHOB|nr:hypothetical protein [Puniceibacterium sediminis]SNR44826.1 hypothetical protein SAMN06265370_105149 [Puniceibacterium sediminis]
MRTVLGPWCYNSAKSFDALAELEHAISLMSQAYELETDLSVNGSDPALSRLLTEAEMLWATASARLHNLVRAPFAQEPIAVAAQHLFALLLSDGTDPGQDRQNLRGLAFLADSMSLQGRTHVQFSRAADLMSQVFADHDPFHLEPPPSSRSLSIKDTDIQQNPHEPRPPLHPDR